MVDPGRVVGLLERLGAEVKAIRQAAARPDDVLHSDDDALPAMKYRLMIAVEAAVDIAEHIIASEGLPPAQSFAESFNVLAEGGWVGSDLAESLADAARFRNLLVHQYADVDDDRVIEIARTRLDDLEDYRTVISRKLV